MKVKPLYCFLFAIALIIANAVTGSDFLMAILIFLALIGTLYLPIIGLVWLIEFVVGLFARSKNQDNSAIEH
jgi:hypothetical protein